MTPNDIKQLLAPTKGTTFAQIETCTPVKPAAKHFNVSIRKHTTANVQLFNNIVDFRNVYEKAVKRSASKINNQKADDFESSGNYFEHTDCFSIVKHKTKDQFYLYCIYNNANSTYTIDGNIATKQDVAQYLTESAKRALLAPSDTVKNKTYGIEHDVIVRTISIDNIVSLTTNKQTIK